MEIFFTKPWLKAFSGLFINLSAGWFGVAFITPILASFSPDVIILLTRDIGFGILFLLGTVKIEEVLEL